MCQARVFSCHEYESHTCYIRAANVRLSASAPWLIAVAGSGWGCDDLGVRHAVKKLKDTFNSNWLFKCCPYFRSEIVIVSLLWYPLNRWCWVPYPAIALVGYESHIVTQDTLFNTAYYVWLTIWNKSVEVEFYFSDKSYYRSDQFDIPYLHIIYGINLLR